MGKRRPSPAMIVAVIALCLGLGGAAIAADLTKPQVKKIAKKVANKQIKKRAPGLSVAHAKTADSATTAATAGTANAVSGVQVRGMDYRADADGAPAQVLNLPGLTIDVSCDGGDLEVIATATLAGELESRADGTTIAEVTAAGDTFDLVQSDDTEVVGTTVFHSVGGDVVELTWAADEGGGEFDCIFAGTATGH